jgi:hypothetical protein
VPNKSIELTKIYEPVFPIKQLKEQFFHNEGMLVHPQTAQKAKLKTSNRRQRMLG